MESRVYYLDSCGAKLFTAVCLPEKCGKFPAIIYRSPYVDGAANLTDRAVAEGFLSAHANFIAGGYAVVCQHCRGTGKSTGDFASYIYEREDGLSLQKWIREQDFYNGELYLCGGSYTASVHFCTAPFAGDIKGAVLEVQDCERYNCIYRNGFYKIGQGVWYLDMYKRKTMPHKSHSSESFKTLPLAGISEKVLGETAEDFEEKLKHPDSADKFWKTRYGGGEAHEAVKHANIPILFTTGFYDIYTGGVFDMWKGLDDDTRAKSAMIVHPYDHGCDANGQPVQFENATLYGAFGDYRLKWFDHIRKGGDGFVQTGKITYYKLFGDKYLADEFAQPDKKITFALGKGEASYVYDPLDPAVFKGGLSMTGGGNVWQDEPFLRRDIISLFTPEFTEDTFVKGKMHVKLSVKSDSEDTCFYVRLSLVKKQGYYGLRDDINMISRFDKNYLPNTEIGMDFCFDEHAFVVKKGEKIRIDISSSAFPMYVPHTNNKGLFSEQTEAKTARNTVALDRSFLTLYCG